MPPLPNIFFLDKAGIMMKARDFIEMYDIVYIRLNYQGDFPSCANTLGAELFLYFSKRTEDLFDNLNAMLL